jgi:hypothetical protein
MENHQLKLFWEASRQWLLIAIGVTLIPGLLFALFGLLQPSLISATSSTVLVTLMAGLNYLIILAVYLVGIHKSHRNYEAFTGVSDISYWDAFKLGAFFLVVLALAQGALGLPIFMVTQYKLGAGGFGRIMVLAVFLVAFVSLLLLIAMLALLGYYRLFKKAELPGWAAIVPIYNLICFLRIGKKPEWWILLLFIPLVNIVISIIATHAVSKAFGKDEGFTLGLIFLPFIFVPLLGFGEEPQWIYGTASPSSMYLEDHLVE